MIFLLELVVPIPLLKFGQLTALAIACETGQTEVAMRVQEGIDLSSSLPEGKTYLTVASQSGSIELVRFIYSRCPDKINAQDHLGWSALIYAIKSMSVAVFGFLSEKGASRSVVTKSFKFDLLEVAEKQKRKLPSHDVEGHQKLEQIIQIVRQVPPQKRL